MFRYNYELKELLDQAKNPKVFSDPRVMDKLVMFGQTQNPYIRDIVSRDFRHYNLLPNPQSLTPHKIPLSPFLTAGDFLAGYTLLGNAIAFSKKELNHHGIVVAQTGKGKSVWVKNLLQSILLNPDKKVSFYLFTPDKEYRPLYKLFPELLVIPSTVYFNDLDPEGLHPDDWLYAFLEVLQETLFFWGSSASVLSGVIKDCYIEHGLYDGSGSSPTLRNVINKMDRNLARYSQLGSNLETLKFKLMAYERALQPNLEKGWISMKAILDSDRPVVFEIPDVSGEYAYAYAVSKLLKIHHYRKGLYK
jgi:hypothetical protein